MIPIRHVAALGTASLAALPIAHRAAAHATALGSGDVIVCIGTDSLMRSPESGNCPDTSTPITLAGPDLKNIDAIDEDDPLGPTNPNARTLSPAIAELERRIEDLERGPVFEVVTREGEVIFRIAPEQVQLFYGSETPVAEMLAMPDGGLLRARAADDARSAVMGAYGAYAGLRLADGGISRLDLLRRAGGNYSFVIPKGRGYVAGIGESSAGTGALSIGNDAGQAKAVMSVDGGVGAVTVYNHSSNPVATIREGVSGAGLMALGNSSGSMLVKLGTNNDDRYGVVLALPLGLPYVPRSGLPGSYMLGCAANPSGRVCLP